MVYTIEMIRYRFSGDYFPSKVGVAEFIQRIAVSLFPLTEAGGFKPSGTRKLRKKFIGLLYPIRNKLKEKPGEIADKFFSELSSIKNHLLEDAEFIALNDPAASGIDEVIMAYPGFFAILIYRLAHCLSGLGVPIVPRIMTEYAHSITGIDIHPGAEIGSEFCIDHGTGIVIGETTNIGNRVKIYQGVTLGALSVSKSMASTKRHPTLEDNVIVYAGATILGGNTIIGHDSVIGGNVWLTQSIPPFSLVYHEYKSTIRERGDKNNKTK
jgi:serine O-acetyltransferase